MEVGLNESAHLFAEAMAEKYFGAGHEKKNCLLVITKHNDDIMCAMLGKDDELIQAVASTMSQDTDINGVISSAFMLANKEEIIKMFNNDRNGFDME